MSFINVTLQCLFAHVDDVVVYLYCVLCKNRLKTYTLVFNTWCRYACMFFQVHARDQILVGYSCSPSSDPELHLHACRARVATNCYYTCFPIRMTWRANICSLYSVSWSCGAPRWSNIKLPSIMILTKSWVRKIPTIALHTSVQLSHIVLFLTLDMDYLCVSRTVPSLSSRACVVSIIDLGMQLIRKHVDEWQTWNYGCWVHPGSHESIAPVKIF